MMEDSRTFTSSACSLTSTTKDQICSPPKKKHSMVLNVGNKSSNVFGVDQTPTPTRFIRNCEEVGLFQDLQNVNPFDETFRKAVESGKTGSLALQGSRLLSVSDVSDDTLHTPHVFPHIIENDAVFRSEMVQRTQHEKSALEESIKKGEEILREKDRGGGVNVGLRPIVKVVRQEADTSQLRSIAPSISTSLEKPVALGTSNSSHPVQLILQMPDGRLMQLNAMPLDVDKKTELQQPVPVNLVARTDKSGTAMGSVILHTAPLKRQESDNISPLIKEKLKARLGNTILNQRIEKSISIPDHRLAQKEDSCHVKRVSTMSNASNSEDDEETKRRRFLERNRAAAMRCREKRKFWVATLEHRAEQMLLTNQQLQLEVGALRAEVAHLKTLLLAHKDCPVTQAMCNNGGGGDLAMVGSASVAFPLDQLQVASVPLPVSMPVQIIKHLSSDMSTFRQNLKKKLRTVSIGKSVPLPEPVMNKVVALKKKRLSLDIETAQQSLHQGSDKDSPLVRSDKYLSSTLLPNDSLELDNLHKPVAMATQVIQVNPNALYRENSLSRGLTSPLLPLSHNMDYS